MELKLRDDRPSYVSRRIRFKHSAAAEKLGRENGILLLPGWSYDEMLKRHGCRWLSKFKGCMHETGRISFVLDGVEFEGTYAFWSKDWHVSMTKPARFELGRHLMYCLPTTLWEKRRQFDVYESMKKDMIVEAEKAKTGR